MTERAVTQGGLRAATTSSVCRQTPAVVNREWHSHVATVQLLSYVMLTRRRNVAQTYRSRHAVVQKPVSIAGSAVLNNIATGYVCLWCVRHEREGQPGMTNQAGEQSNALKQQDLPQTRDTMFEYATNMVLGRKQQLHGRESSAPAVSGCRGQQPPETCCVAAVAGRICTLAGQHCYFERILMLFLGSCKYQGMQQYPHQRRTACPEGRVVTLPRG